MINVMVVHTMQNYNLFTGSADITEKRKNKNSKLVINAPLILSKFHAITPQAPKRKYTPVISAYYGDIPLSYRRTEICFREIIPLRVSNLT